MKNMSELARAIGKTPQLLSAYSRGCATPSLKTAKALAAVVPGTDPFDWMEKPAEMISQALGGEGDGFPEAA